MKKLIVFVLFLVVSIFALQGTSHAVYGVVDNVPGTDVVFPIICEKGATMNTLFATADVSGVGASADLVVYDSNSNWVYDDSADWTPYDVLPGDCQSLIAKMSTEQKAALETTINGRTYYVGYLAYYNVNSPADQLISWVYLVDLTKGFASGFNGFSAEGGLTSELCESFNLGGNSVGVCQSSVLLFPRYLLLNNLTETWNWWILLYGDNDSGRVLTGTICNEEEGCVSLNIPVPQELNIINVEPHVPATLHAGYPKAGFGWFVNSENDYNNSVMGWSYQRAQGSSVAATWDVIHPIHGLNLPTVDGTALPVTFIAGQDPRDVCQIPGICPTPGVN